MWERKRVEGKKTLCYHEPRLVHTDMCSHSNNNNNNDTIHAQWKLHADDKYIVTIIVFICIYRYGIIWLPLFVVNNEYNGNRIWQGNKCFCVRACENWRMENAFFIQFHIWIIQGDISDHLLLFLSYGVSVLGIVHILLLTAWNCWNYQRNILNSSFLSWGPKMQQLRIGRCIMIVQNRDLMEI